MCTIALILLGLASIPFTNTRHPRIYPLCTPVGVQYPGTMGH
jgi:hypothetical protein